jgi:segregation and condensation protein B
MDEEAPGPEDPEQTADTSVEADDDAATEDTDTAPSKPHPTSDPKLLVEGMLFSAGHAMQVVELEQATGLERREVLRQLKRLASEYRRRNTSLEVAKVGNKWTMQLRVELTPQARTVAPLALIAYHQPVLQSQLQEMIGPKVYEQVRELSGLGLVIAQARGSTKQLTTTQKFLEYFGIPSTRRDHIKRFLAERVGITLPETVPPPPAEAVPEGTAPEGAVPQGEAPEGGTTPPPAPEAPDAGAEPPEEGGAQG